MSNADEFDKMDYPFFLEMRSSKLTLINFGTCRV